MSPRALRSSAPLLVLVVGGLAACGDPPPAADVAPIEIVLDGCALNRASVAAGTHEITAVGTGEVTLTGPGGMPSVRVAGSTDPRAFELGAGTWEVACTTPSASTEARLTVTD